jgi:hypothetical protein
MRRAGSGSCCWDVAFKPAEIHDILLRHGSGAPAIKEQMVLSGVRIERPEGYRRA